MVVVTQKIRSVELRLSMTDSHVTNEECRDHRMYLFMAQVRDKIAFDALG